MVSSDYQLRIQRNPNELFPTQPFLDVSNKSYIINLYSFFGLMTPQRAPVLINTYPQTPSGVDSNLLNVSKIMKDDKDVVITFKAYGQIKGTFRATV